MAHLLYSFFFLFLLFLLPSAALKVTAGSPCASLCANGDTAVSPETNSSSVANSEFVCDDEEFASDPEGQKRQKCLACLEESTFVNGDENDQMWFLYNMRYSVGYCILGLHNATGVGSNPCQTTTACGALKGSLLEDDVDPESDSQYEYCESGGRSAIPSDEFSLCLSCVRTGGTHGYLTNFLVALEAGCSQKPTPGQKLSLNDTVFANTSIHLLEVAPSSPEDDNSGLPPTTIAAIAVSAVVGVLLVAGCGFILWRKYLRNGERSPGEKNFTKGWVKRTKFGNFGGRKTTSSLDFRCRTRVTPLASRFDFRGVGLEEDDVPSVRSPDLVNADEKAELRNQEEERRRLEEERRMHFVHPGDALGSNPVLALPTSATSSPSTQYPYPPPQHPLPEPPTSSKPPQTRTATTTPSSYTRPPYTPPPRPRMGSLNVVTTTPPTSSPPQFPRSTHSSPMQRHSPSAHSTATPSSATSQAPLLPVKLFPPPQAATSSSPSSSHSPSEAMGPVVRWLQEQRVARDSRGGSIRERYQDDEKTAAERSRKVSSPQSTNWTPVDPSAGRRFQGQRADYEDPGKQWDISNVRGASGHNRTQHSRSNARLMGQPSETRILPTSFAPPPGQ